MQPPLEPCDIHSRPQMTCAHATLQRLLPRGAASGLRHVVSGLWPGEFAQRVAWRGLEHNSPRIAAC